MRLVLRRGRRVIAEGIYALLVSLALFAAFLLRFDFTLPAPYPGMLLKSLPVLLVAKLAVFRAFRLRDLAWRYFGFRDLLLLAGSNLAASAAAAVLLRPFIGSAFPRSIHFIDFLVCAASMAAVHAAAKLTWESGRRGSTIKAPVYKRVAIYGAGSAGAVLAGEILAHPEAGYSLVAFFDDDALKRGLQIRGTRVLGDLARLPLAIRKHRIETVLLAMPAATGPRLSAIVEACRAEGVIAKRVPALAELEENQILLRQIREVRIEDLLHRRPVEFPAGGRKPLIGTTVLVTGAGGSIGSELCRQIARRSPAALIGLDHSESALYEIDRELRARYPHLRFVPEIGNIQNRRRLEQLFRQHAPHSVYHAAAYKHVPLMEAQLFEAIENNVFGTRNVAQVAAESGAREFVLISSDKAVQPANVMGATKRLAEMAVQTMAQAMAETAPEDTRFLAVRFGNVLGSSGSVIPVFREQIARGGPVTVTHPEMQRFFMTIPEAAQLVLEAAAMAPAMGPGGARRTGEIFVLEMGDPVRIVDLARQMIRLSGLEPGRDIGIEFTGVRPGEKLYEELSAYEESTIPTPHPGIRLYAAPPPPAARLARGLSRLAAAVEDRDAPAALGLLQELIPSYRPSSFVLGRAREEKARAVFA